MVLKKDFKIGDQVRVSGDHGWLGAPVGVVSSLPDPIETIQGEDYFYWVRFDPPVRDSDGDGPYKSAQILSRALVLDGEVRHEVADPDLEARTVAWVFSILDAEPQGSQNLTEDKPA